MTGFTLSKTSEPLPSFALMFLEYNIILLKQYVDNNSHNLGLRCKSSYKKCQDLSLNILQK